MKTKRIRIGAIDYQIKMVKDLRDGDQKLNGWIRHNESRLEFDDSLASQAEYITLWHEILHGLLTQGGIPKQKERIVEVLAHGIVSVLRDNPWLTNCRWESANEEANDERQV